MTKSPQNTTPLVQVVLRVVIILIGMAAGVLAGRTVAHSIYPQDSSTVYEFADMGPILATFCASMILFGVAGGFTGAFIGKRLFSHKNNASNEAGELDRARGKP